MKNNYRIAKEEAKELIIKLGRHNILNMHVTEVMHRTGVDCLDMQNAFSFYDFSKSQEKFRNMYY